MIECKKCNAQFEDDNNFCPECGEPVAASTETVEESAVEDTKEKSAGSKKSKPVIMGIAAVLALVVVVVIIAAIFSGSKRTSMILYKKDNQLCFTYAKKIKPFEVTDELYGGESKSGTPSFVITNNATKIFYSEEISGGSYDLYYRSLKKAKKEGEKIASDVDSFEVTPNGKTVYFISGSSLYSHNLKDKTKIDEDVTRFYMTEDGKKLLYLVKVETTDEDGKTTSSTDLYYKKNAKKDGEKLSSAASSVKYTDDFSVIAFLKDGDTLYYSAKGKEAKKVASDVDYYYVLDNGDFVYEIVEEKTAKYSDIIKDTLKDEERPSSSDDGYANWQAREVIRRRVLQEDTEEKFEYSISKLCYFDGKKETVLTESLSDIVTGNTEENVFVYTAYESYSLPTVDITKFTDELDINSVYEIEDYIQELMETDVKLYAAQGKKSFELLSELEKVSDYAINAKADKFYFIEDEDLYEMKLKNGKAGKKDKIASDVASVACLPDSDDIIYIADYNEEKSYGDLYMNKKKVDTDVYCPYGSFSYFDVYEDTILYMVDYNAEKGEGQLKYFNGKKAIKVADDVKGGKSMFLPNGEIVYIGDWNTEKSYGTLFFSKNGKKSKKVSDDVQAVYGYYYSESDKIASYNN